MPQARQHPGTGGVGVSGATPHG